MVLDIQFSIFSIGKHQGFTSDSSDQTLKFSVELTVKSSSSSHNAACLFTAFVLEWSVLSLKIDSSKMDKINTKVCVYTQLDTDTEHCQDVPFLRRPF